MKRLNLNEIGRLAGVTRSTVSRVVNGKPNVISGSSSNPNGTAGQSFTAALIGCRATGEPTDQRGVARDAACDVGAYEYMP